jgi:two-component system chemotaxis response regulator CheB
VTSPTVPFRARPAHAAEVTVVALVCSSGGLDALRRVLRPLPAGIGAAFVVLQHQAPGADSVLASILGRSCDLDVRVAVDGSALERGVVHVIPPGKHALVTTSRTLRLITSGPPPPYRPSADLLLATLATAVGEDGVAVILSGSGSDAATGGTAVHAFGGLVIASDEATSESFSMPHAAILRDGVVDHVLPVDEIGPMLVERLAIPLPPAARA